MGKGYAINNLTDGASVMRDFNSNVANL